MRRTLVVLMLAAGCWNGPARAESSHSHLLMVVAKKLPGVTIYDADTEQVLCRAGGMALSPHEAAFSPDGRYAYVPVYGSSGVGAPGTDEHVLHFVRTADCKDVFTLDTGENKRPHGIAVGSSGKIYLTTEISESVLVIDPKQHKIIGRIPTGSKTSHMLAVSKDERKIYTANVQSKSVSVLDVPDQKLAATVPTGVEDQRMEISPDGKYFVTSLGPDHDVAFFRTSDNHLDHTIKVDGTPFANQYSVDGKHLYEVGMIHGKIGAWKIDLNDGRVVGTLENLGSAIGTIEVNPFNGRVFVSDSGGDKISEIDPDTWKVVKVLDTDKTPDQMLFVVRQ